MKGRPWLLAMLLWACGPGCRSTRSQPSAAPAPPADLGRAASAAELLAMELYVQERAAPASAIQQRFTLEGGAAVECVELHQQRALRNRPRQPIALLPRTLPAPIVEVRAARTSLVDRAPPLTCPEGTIPVPSVSLEQLKQFPTLAAYLGGPHPTPQAAPGTPSLPVAVEHRGARDPYQYAIADFAPEGKLLVGAQAFFSLWQPRIDRWDEHSLAELAVVYRSSQQDLFETIEVGWRVFPGRYRDPSPHLFVFTSRRTPSRDNRFESWCYDLDCPNFVRTSRKLLGLIPRVSARGGPPEELHLGIYRELEADRWWIYVDAEPLGYFEREAYGFFQWATEIQLYGEVWSSRQDRHTGTEMGSGVRPASDGPIALERQVAYFRDVRVSPLLGPGLREHTGTRATDRRCYDVRVLSLPPPWNTTVFYGGPGYTPGLCE